jgi:hypothetical protein
MKHYGKVIPKIKPFDEKTFDLNLQKVPIYYDGLLITPISKTKYVYIYGDKMGISEVK